MAARHHAGRTVRLEAGAAAAAGAVLGAAALPGRAGAAAALAAAAGAACGRYDDVHGDHRRGFRAHLSALRDGEVTSGAVKLVGVGAAGLAAGALLKRRPPDALLAGVVVAGTAHLVNLLDVRPGRAVCAVLAAGAPAVLRGAPLAAAPVGARRPCWPTTWRSARCSATWGRTRWAEHSGPPSPPVGGAAASW
ncbi:hypothetical protein [Streptomyces sp. CC210A]|uniref:hypothetical protein n=1 Tax=Streptomyces sp. CC210A TaxID=2898184 RepID=UPI0035A94B6D